MMDPVRWTQLGDEPLPLSQRILGIVENFCVSFGFKVNISKTEICVFNKRGANIHNIQTRYLGELIKVVDAIKYLGLNFSGIKNLSPNIKPGYQN